MWSSTSGHSAIKRYTTSDLTSTQETQCTTSRPTLTRTTFTTFTTTMWQSAIRQMRERWALDLPHLTSIGFHDFSAPSLCRSFLQSLRALSSRLYERELLLSWQMWRWKRQAQPSNCPVRRRQQQEWRRLKQHLNDWSRIRVLHKLNSQ